MRSRTRVGVLAAALATVGSAALAPVAHAEETPTARQLLMKCDNGSDVCIFHPDGPPQISMGPSHQVGDSAFNCTQDTQRSGVGWSDTTGETNSVGLSMSAEYGFGEVFKVTVEASYEHTWSNSHTETDTTYIDVRPNEVGWVTREAQMQTVTGTYELHFPDPYYGHYYWYVPFTATGPVPDAPSTKTQHTRAMTGQEQASHCG
ncbi:hypothetical protein [Streptomyces sp. TR06-5]|uniref:hypothetical protein n=1 Tax=unclassified Streptomyces TaxID=2593676 RepID=UPI00399F7810